MTSAMAKRSMNAAVIAARLSANVILNIGAMASAPKMIPATTPYESGVIVACLEGAEARVRVSRRCQHGRSSWFSQHPRRHRSHILHDGRLDRVHERRSEVVRLLHQHRLVDQVPLGAVR